MVLATKLLRFIHERKSCSGPRNQLHIQVTILWPSGLLPLSRHGCHLAVGSTPFDFSGELDAMHVLRVEPQLQDGLESLDTFRSLMRARGRFTIVEPLNVAVDVVFPSFPVEELLHSGGGRKGFVP